MYPNNCAAHLDWGHGGRSHFPKTQRNWKYVRLNTNNNITAHRFNDLSICCTCDFSFQCCLWQKGHFTQTGWSARTTLRARFRELDEDDFDVLNIDDEEEHGNCELDEESWLTALIIAGGKGHNRADEASRCFISEISPAMPFNVLKTLSPFCWLATMPVIKNWTQYRVWTHGMSEATELILGTSPSAIMTDSGCGRPLYNNTDQRQLQKYNNQRRKLWKPQQPGNYILLTTTT
jgi:hypothetical protein